MPTYPVYNKETGEQKNVVMSIHAWDQWLVDNPGWVRDWSDPSTAPMDPLKSGTGEINSFPKNQVGTRYLKKLHEHLDHE